MKKKNLRFWTISLGIFVVFLLTAMSFNHSFNARTDHETHTKILGKYKSMPVIATPLYILAKGLNIVNK
ncbi:hypothetical protein [Fulvivirga lutimaris]|uniref:hypothetical protein n=1 Tax=Fulvivirga lutimaris TaxID=1819566 RepID=UPI0012BB6DE7|nr:hypothetical protein [Fulvivirga lutimaris]MTI40973.1 hypothetical protein [Fulvivirga lutimaris]